MKLQRQWNLVVVSIISGTTYAPIHAESPRFDPSKVLGSQSCVKCHQSEFEVWQRTPHFKTFRALHRTPEAKAIAKRMGLSSIKRSGTCMQCHYTQQQQGTETKAISGVSCESCHAASKDWIDVHHDYGGPKITRESESVAHRQQRRERAIELGMCSTQNLYLIAKNCYNCHTTPNEQLVNVGKHPPGSLDFELVSWSQGLVHHNFLDADGKRKDVSDPGRLRVMYLVGIMTDLEFSLRATALATQKAEFGITNARRANTAKKKLIAVRANVEYPFLRRAIDAVNRVKLKLNNKDQLLLAADEVGKAAYDFAEAADGRKLTAIDAYLPTRAQYK